MSHVCDGDARPEQLQTDLPTVSKRVILGSTESGKGCLIMTGIKLSHLPTRLCSLIGPMLMSFTDCSVVCGWACGGLEGRKKL